jgi:exosome complex component RRP4
MINMIAELTSCEIKVGQNGVVVIDGPVEGVRKAVEVIQLIEQEAHTADLTAKVQQLLGAPVSAPPTEAAGPGNSGEQ